MQGGDGGYPLLPDIYFACLIRRNSRWLYHYHCYSILQTWFFSKGFSCSQFTLKFFSYFFFYPTDCVYIFFISGNHELWIRQLENTYCHNNSIDKFHAILAMCDSIGVHTKPVKVQCCNDTAAWVVPIFSWYAKPEDDLHNSLFVGRDTEDAELSNKVWMDNHLCKWPVLQGSVAQYFAKLNENILTRDYDAPIISFSHFLPRGELIPASEEDIERVQDERKKLHLPQLDNPKAQGSQIQFNFTRFAGCKTIEEQVRKIGSKVHLHGHQHRNRDRVIDEVRYVSFCLGYPRERSMGVIWGLSERKGPRWIWP